MTIFRVEHNQNYTSINNTIAKDKRLSWKAKGIWLYAFSRKDNWEFNITDLTNQATDGRDSVRAGLRELEEHGYLQRNYRRDNEMKFSKADWVFYEVPQIKEKIPATGFPSTEKPSTGKASTENPTLSSTEKVSTDLSKNRHHQQDDDGFSSKEPDKPKASTKPKEKPIEPGELQFDDVQREELNNYTSQQIQDATAKTIEGCKSKANASRVKYFFTVLENSPKKSSSSTKLAEKKDLEAINREIAKKMLKEFKRPLETISLNVQQEYDNALRIDVDYRDIDVSNGKKYRANDTVTIPYNEFGFAEKLEKFFRKNAFTKKG